MSEGITPKQVAFLKKLVQERQVAEEHTDRVQTLWTKLEMSAPPIGKDEASTFIRWYLKRPIKKTDVPLAPKKKENAPQALTPGVFENSDGIFVVKPNRQKTKMYAKKLIEIGGERVTESGEHVNIEFVYSPGAIYKLTEQDRMPLEKAKKLTIRYGRCIVCGRRLKAAQSVERGIGPVCVRSFA